MPGDAPLKSSAQEQLIGNLVDTATGYIIMIKRVENEDYSISYHMDLFGPDDGEPIDETGFVPLNSDGTGPRLIGQV